MVQFQRALLFDAQDHVSSRMAAGSTSAPRSYEGHLSALTLREIDEFFERQSAELELLTTFELLASVEAILRLDLRDRVMKKRKDAVSRRFRGFRNRDRLRLDEDILEVWSAEAQVSVSEFRTLLKLRHWLAHGRYWLPRLGQQRDAADVYRISTKLLNSIHTAMQLH
jgi:hypothetical protein